MINPVDRIQDFFIGGKKIEDEEERRKTKILVNTLLLSALFGTFYLGNTLLFEMHYIMFNMIFCVCSFTIILFLFKYGISRTAAANMFSFVALASSVYNIYFSKGLFSWCFAWLSMSPVLALLLTDRKLSYIWLGLSVCCGIVVGVLHIQGYYFPNDINPKYYYIMTLNALIGLVLIMYFISFVLDDASRRALAALETKNQDIRWQKALAEAERRRAIESEKFKQQFLTNMSHEIRTPMNAILGLTNVLIEKNPGKEQLKELEIIKSSSESLYTIINDILDLSKIEAGRLELEEIPFEPKRIVKTVAETFDLKAKEKGLQLKVSYDESIPATLIGDPTRLTQILTNLVSNAVKFTVTGTVALGAKKEKDGIGFSVSDTGIGLTKEQLAIIFEPFRQADAGTTRKYGGTGLGLSISKELISLHHSKLNVESIPGKGSTFSFVIKYSTAIETVPQQKNTEVTQAMLDELKGLKILLAEDNEFNRVVAIETLEMKIPGVVINIAENGKEAVEKITGHDLILMDMHMPVMDGYEATRRIRAISSVPIIALTASVLEDNFDRCLELGMNDVLTKPFKTELLLLAIYNAVKGKSSVASRRNMVLKEPEQNTKVSDINVLKIFCDEDMQRVKKYIGIYLKSAPTMLSKMEKQIGQNDLNALKITVHTFRTHLKYMGMDDAAFVAKRMESICEDGHSSEDLDRLLVKLNEFCLRSFDELREFA